MNIKSPFRNTIPSIQMHNKNIYFGYINIRRVRIIYYTHVPSHNQDENEENFTELKCRYLLYCARHVSCITIIIYVPCRKIGKLNYYLQDSRTFLKILQDTRKFFKILPRSQDILKNTALL